MTDIAWTVQTNAVGTYDVRSTCGSSSYIVADDLPIEDARMISAAPDLYEALNAMLVEFEIQESDGDLSPLFDQVRAALRKARGEP